MTFEKCLSWREFHIPTIVFAVITLNEEERLLKILKEYKIALGWLIVDIKV